MSLQCLRHVQCDWLVDFRALRVSVLGEMVRVKEETSDWLTGYRALKMYTIQWTTTQAVKKQFVLGNSCNAESSYSFQITIHCLNSMNLSVII